MKYYQAAHILPEIVAYLKAIKTQAESFNSGFFQWWKNFVLIHSQTLAWYRLPRKESYAMDF